MSTEVHGRHVADVVLEIDYNIIQHFSEHLYGSPNKAVEELVANSFDAFASMAYVYIPSQFTENYVLVWDDGGSMDIGDLHKLWWIAQSPKVGDRMTESEDGRRRAMIGKFGIGKLASYAVGYRITHLCRQDNRYLLVKVDYRDVPHIQDETEHEKYKAPILELTEEEAREYVKSLFLTPPKAHAQLWNKDTWTLAIIDQLKDNANLTEGRLSWVIGNGMPLRPDFRVWVNDKQVEPKLARGAMMSWDFAEPKLQEAFASAWKSARAERKVEGDYDLEPTLDGEPAVWLPKLGTVRAEVHMFQQSLKNLEPRSYGFFVMVRDRLLNPNDEQFLLSVTDPHFGSFYRCQYVIHADGLDQDLLADREHLRVDTPRTRELTVLQDALYRMSRQELNRFEQAVADQIQGPASTLPADSREFFREPLTALQLRHGDAPTKPYDPAQAARVERAPLGLTEPISLLDSANNTFVVNIEHPFLKTAHEKVRGNRKAQEVIRALDLFAVAEKLFEGFLYDLGLADEQIDRILAWRDGLLRAMALQYATAPADEVINEVLSTSYVGNKPFEKALAKLFERMGFAATHDGLPGRKDVLVVAPIGKEEYRFTVEAKGSRSRVGNDAAEIGGALAHRDQIGARFALIVAREFIGFQSGRDQEPAILQECRSARGVTLVTVDTLVELLKATLTYHYPLDMLLPVLEEIEPPSAKLKRVGALRRPTADFDFRGVLEEVWNLQQGKAVGDMVPIRGLWQESEDRWGCELDDFQKKLFALETLSGGLLRVYEREQAVILHQSPEIVADSISLAVELQRKAEEPR